MTMTYEQMKNVDIRTVDPATVTDAGDIHIDASLPIPKRMKNYARQAGNVYFIKVNGVLVKMGFSDTTDTINDCMERYLKTC